MTVLIDMTCLTCGATFHSHGPIRFEVVGSSGEDYQSIVKFYGEHSRCVFEKVV